MNRLLAVTLFFLSMVLNFHTGLGQEKKKTKSVQTKRTKIEDDDTRFIQSLIDKAIPGDTIKLAKRIYHVRSLQLKSGVSVHTLGTLKQIKPDSAENFTMGKQYSEHPLFYGNKVKGLSLRFNAFTYGEAVRLDNAENITIQDVVAFGDSTKLYSFSGIYLFRSKNINIENAELAYYGMPRKSPNYYQRGTGIRLQTCSDVTINENRIHHNGENGVFLHSCANITLNRNKISHNGMSGIQVAFGSVGLENTYQITNNLIFANAADAIDINNPDISRQINLAALIEGNTSYDNGWVKGEKTRDGSGIATLVGLKNIMVRNNKSNRSNRPAVYLRDCDAVQVINNNADNFAEIVGSQGQIHLYKNTFAGLRLLSDLKAKKLMLDSNNIRYLAIPNGIMVDSLVFLANDLKGNINVNMSGQLIFKDNVLSSSSPRGGISLWKVNGAVLSGNEISANKSDALYVHNEAMNVVIEANKIRSSTVCIKDAGSQQLKIIKNTLASDTSNRSTSTLISTNPKDLTLSNNTYYLGEKEAERAVEFEGEGTVFIDGETHKLFTPDGNN
ncbi:right-handed parallel beta-helix repeat-containing protein [Olivibacter sp. 47]|uniref:right-handed parallel beta-helix repeat-containing protein n=1 Tax=Olivibacter sp. 47 TaxID=3056486 RepID=UPI0025A4C7F9|nr:right-handed parallel beta-helix repeat-containing protein [Olivibacter sp. 47]MDM8174090.1 right-handed parallel beta-helix repeat-containing protein [Olivibacter sp. 47]